MANEEYEMTFSVNEAQTRQELEEISRAAEQAQKKLKAVAAALEDTFTFDDLSNYQKTALRYGKDLADHFLVMRLRLGQLKAAFVDAAMPVANVFIPVVNRALNTMIQWVRGAGAVLNELFGSEEQPDALAQSLLETADAGKTLKKSVKSTGKTVKKALLDFDKIQRLSMSTSGGGSASSEQLQTYNPRKYILSPKAQAALDTILRFLKPLQEIDFSALTASFERLKGVLEELGDFAKEVLSWVWFEVLVPMATWSIEEEAPRTVDLLRSAFELLLSVLRPVWEGLKQIWEALQPVVNFIREKVLQVIEKWSLRFSQLAELFREKGPEITGIFQNIGQIISAVWEQIQPVLSALWEGFSYTFGGIWEIISGVISNVISTLGYFTGFLSGVFTGDVEGAIDDLGMFISSSIGGLVQLLGQVFLGAIQGFLGGLYSFAVAVGEIFGFTEEDVRGAINGIIGLINGMISGIVSGINTVIRALNRLDIDIPDWVPKFGGKSFGFNISTLNTPTIPYLAQGAVIPPNRQFLAVLGDQKQGTNIEAPLDTIKQALAEVMAMQDGGNITVNFTGDLAQLGRVLKPVIDRENVRVGGSLVRGVL